MTAGSEPSYTLQLLGKNHILSHTRLPLIGLEVQRVGQLVHLAPQTGYLETVSHPGSLHSSVVGYHMVTH